MSLLGLGILLPFVVIIQSSTHSAHACGNPQATRKAKQQAKQMGGVQRAFTRLKTLGTSGKPDLRAVSQQLKLERAANTADFQRATAMAAALSRAKRLGLTSPGPAYGKNRRAVKKDNLKKMRLAVWQRFRGQDQDHRMISISGHVVQQRLSLHECLALARSMARFDAQQQARAAEEAKATLTTFRTGPGAEQVAKLVEALPGLAKHTLTPEPVGQTPTFDVQGSDAMEVIKATAWAQSAARSCNLAATMAQDWRAQHMPAQPVVGPIAKHDADVVSACYIAGVCLCSGSGPKVRVVAELFLKQMKKQFSRASNFQGKLLDGRVVARFIGETDTDAAGDNPDLGNGCCDMWYHIGMHYLNPYRPTFMKVLEAEAPEGELAGHGRLYVKATGASACAAVLALLRNELPSVWYSHDS